MSWFIPSLMSCVIQTLVCQMVDSCPRCSTSSLKVNILQNETSYHYEISRVLDTGLKMLNCVSRVEGAPCRDLDKVDSRARKKAVSHPRVMIPPSKQLNHKVQVHKQTVSRLTLVHHVFVVVFYDSMTLFACLGTAIYY